MRRPRISPGVVCGLLSLFFISLTPALYLRYQQDFALREPYFRAPLRPVSGVLFLRRDVYGKGFFGASRNGKRSHQGIDILASVGEPILAAKSGRVAFSGMGKGYGNYVEILHPDGLVSRYAHLQRLYVAQGEWLVAGQVIGICGKTGNASDPRIKAHLHFEIRASRGPLNPGKLLAPGICLQNT